MWSRKLAAWRNCRISSISALRPFLLLLLAGLGGCDGPDMSDCASAPAAPQNVLLGGSCGARVTVRLSGAPFVCGDYFLRLQDSGAGESADRISLHNPRRISAGLSFDLPQVPRHEGLYELAGLPDSKAGEGITLARDAVRIVNSFKVVLSFDDGPAVCGRGDTGSPACGPTWETLNVLDRFRHGPGDSREGIKAIFFVLTTPDTFLWDTFYKAETPDGFALLQEQARRGHLLGVHWGGDYVKQTTTHLRRVNLPPYQWRAGEADIGQNALESDLLECISRITEATGQAPRYIRPPLWRFSSRKNPQLRQQVKEVYRRLGLKMILTDARYPDGGYAIISIISPYEGRKYKQNLARAFLGGETNLIISMHDSNTHTARRLPGILETIKDLFAQTSFGGVYGDPGEYLDFATSAEQIEAVLAQKRRYTTFPCYRPLR